LAIQNWTDRRFGHQQGFRLALGESTPIGVAAKTQAQYQSNEHDRGEHHQRERSKKSELTLV
jgi:hypothetical protein